MEEVIVMKRNLLAIGFLTFFAACSSGPPSYEKMRTADQALNQYDQNTVKNGMAITKKGAVIDVTVEEVQAQKNRLAFENQEKDKKIDALQERIRTMESDMSQLRSYIGLSATKPKAQGKCCTPEGNLIPGTIIPAPTLDEELAALKEKQRVATSPGK
jgi:hypothetical protein